MSEIRNNVVNITQWSGVVGHGCDGSRQLVMLVSATKETVVVGGGDDGGGGW